jgi:predicted  nucleic acid-binding Zn-ribbon protein
LNEQLKLLIELQEIDSSILSLNERIESLPERLNASKTNLDKATAAYKKVKTRHDELIKKKKGKDFDIDEKQEAINKLKTRTGAIKTNKEYEAYLREIELLEKIKYDAEEEVLSAMEEIESIADDLKSGEVMVREAEVELEKDGKELEEEKKSLEQEMEVHRSKRNVLLEKIESDTYSQYMKNLKRSGGIAIAPAEDEICKGCNTNMPPQLFNDLKDNDKLIKCFYCGRFLYIKENPDPPK